MNGNEEVKKFAQYQEEPVHTKKEICPTCEGGGTTVFGWGSPYGEPSLVLDADQRAEMDPEYFDMMMAGDFDKPCPECRGRNVVDVIDRDKNAPEVLEAWDKWEYANWEAAMESAAERRVGA